MKDTKTTRAIYYSGAILIVISAVLLFMMLTFDIEAIRSPASVNPDSIIFEFEELSRAQQIYFNFKQWMYNLESSITNFSNIGLIFLAMLLFFALKSFISVVPISATCFLSGVLFPFPLAIVVNYLGLAAQISIKFLWGYKLGGGNIAKILNRYPVIIDILEHDGKGNPWFLFIFRLVPSFPINPISQMYGDMHFDFKNFMLISLAGFSIKIFLFTIIGSNVFDPLSRDFILPIIIILFISGSSMMLANAIITFTSKKSIEKKRVLDEKK